MRDYSVADSSLLLEWRNSIDARRYSRNQKEISADEHNRWLASRVLNEFPGPFWIITINEAPIGYVRFDLNVSDERVFEVSIFLTSDFRHTGLGKKSLILALQSMGKKFTGYEIIATVHIENKGSVKLFKSLGFTLKNSHGFFQILSLRLE